MPFIIQPNHICFYIGWICAKACEKASKISDVIAFAPCTIAPCTEWNCFSQSTFGICWKWIKDLIESSSKTQYISNRIPNERISQKRLFHPTIPRVKHIFVLENLNYIPCSDDSFEKSIGCQIPSLVCTSVKNIHFKEGNQFPLLLEDNYISWLNNITFQAFVPGMYINITMYRQWKWVHLEIDFVYSITMYRHWKCYFTNSIEC